jgi:hypothetical protein
MNDERDAAASAPEKMEHGTQAGDDFRNGFSCGFWRPEAVPGRPPENRPFIWRGPHDRSDRLPRHTHDKSQPVCVEILDLAPVSMIVRSVSDNVRQVAVPVSVNLRQKPPLIARRYM